MSEHEAGLAEHWNPAELVARDLNRELAIATQWLENGVRLIDEIVETADSATRHIGDDPTLDMVRTQADMVRARIAEILDTTRPGQQ